MDQQRSLWRLLSVQAVGLSFILLIQSAYAQDGCCSSHEGVNRCDPDTGYYLCNDGSRSPSCECSATSAVGEPTSSTSFSDVSPSSPYATAIGWAKSSGIIQGYSDGTFRPDSPINRAELMKILVKGALHVDPSPASGCFPDVGSEWFSPYVCYAASMKWVQGYPDGRFRPENNLNDAEALKMIVVSIVGADKITADSSCDQSQWYGIYLCTAERMNIVLSGQFDAGETISRGKVTLWLYNAVQGNQISSFQPDARTKTSGCLVMGPYPDHACTPGAVFSGVTVAEICTSSYSDSERSVSKSLKNKVYAAYGIETRATGQYVIDHFIPLELGGSNDIANLWPEAGEPRPGSNEKNIAGNYLKKQVCNISMTLSEAQREITTDWVRVYENWEKSRE